MNARRVPGLDRTGRVWDMPIFEYRCESCGETSEFIEGVIEQAQAVLCARCGSPEMKRLLSRAVGAAKKETAGGATCCGRPERCDRPPCGGEGRCGR